MGHPYTQAPAEARCRKTLGVEYPVEGERLQRRKGDATWLLSSSLIRRTADTTGAVRHTASQTYPRNSMLLPA